MIKHVTCTCKVIKAVLVELADPAVSHEATTRCALSKIAPAADLLVHHLQRSGF
jgi:hypothetical protein